MSNEQTISREELQELLAFKREWEQDKQRKLDLSHPLPEEIVEDLELPKANLRKLCNTFNRTRINYDNEWTRGTVINRQYIGECNKANVSATSAIQGRYKDSEKLRTMASASAELFEEIQAIIGDLDEESTAYEHWKTIGERARRQAVYGFSSAQAIDDEARTWLEKAIGVPEHLRYADEDEDKKLAIPAQLSIDIKKSKFEQAVLTRAAGGPGNSQRYQNSGFSQRGRGNGGGRGRGRGTFQSKPRLPHNQPAPETPARPGPVGNL
ncbi:hypothetical protein CLU79DRAFT_724006 [Phycomyces nitens]|nr:hypothetical protein CLU79DRAFT_724006 [Phycomyces nitens]